MLSGKLISTNQNIAPSFRKEEETQSDLINKMSNLDEESEEISQIKEEIKRSRERETDFRQKILSYEDGAESEDKGMFSLFLKTRTLGSIHQTIIMGGENSQNIKVKMTSLHLSLSSLSDLFYPKMINGRMYSIFDKHLL